jgi:hypothetical protein
MKQGAWTSRGKALAGIAAWLFGLMDFPVAAARDAPCDIVLSTTSVDYGRLTRATLAVEASGLLGLPARTVGIHVRCPEPRDMTIFFRGTPAGADGFRFTDTGRFTLHLHDAFVDGAPVDLGQVDRQGGVPTRTGASLSWLPDQGLTPVKRGQTVMGREFSAQMEILAQVDERSLAVVDATRWVATGHVETATTASSRELTLQADVQPGRCNVEVVRDVSFGHVRSTDLDSHGASTRIPATRSGQLQVLCDGPVPFAFRVTSDERAGTAVAPVGVDVVYPEGQLFGLGKTPAGQNIGAYVLQWRASASSDRGELRSTRSVDGGRSWGPVAGAVMADHAGSARLGYATTQDAAAGPLAVKALDVMLDATIFVAPKQLISLNEEIRADGLATIEIIY